MKHMGKRNLFDALSAQVPDTSARWFRASGIFFQVTCISRAGVFRHACAREV